MKNILLFPLFFLPFFAFAKEAEIIPGKPLPQTSPMGYNIPGATSVTHKLNKGLAGTDLFLEAAFTWWYIGQEGLKVASNSVLNSTTLSYADNTNSYFPSFNFEPGFKVALGTVDKREYEYRIGYTWAHTNKTTSAVAPVEENLPAGSTTVAAGTAVLALDNWFLQSSTGNQALAASSLTSKWNLDFNLIDFTIGRPYYQGPSLIASPFGGLEVGFISQNFNVDIYQATGQISNLPVQPLTSRNSSSSWGVGPLLGIDTKYIWRELRLLTKGSFGLLYTNYTSVKHSEERASTDFNPSPYTASFSNYYAMRPNADLELGLGWNRYFNSHNQHIDLRLTYDFSIYFAQNMMRTLLNDVFLGASAAPSNLFFQGLTASARIDF